MVLTPATNEFVGPREAAAGDQGHQRERARNAVARPNAGSRTHVSHMRLRLSATPAGLPFARASLTLLCKHLRIDEERVERIRLAITEACTNCVLHAFNDAAPNATYVLDARLDHGALRVIVCDRGVGLRSARLGAHGGLGFGLALIKQLADSTEVSSRTGGGTRIVMRFALPS